MPISTAQAKKYLTSVRPEKSFWVNNGPIVNNLKSLPKAVEEMSEDQFKYHVNREKNDFSSWIQEIIGDKSLAKELKHAKSRRNFLTKLKKRVETLKKVAS